MRWPRHHVRPIDYESTARVLSELLTGAQLQEVWDDELDKLPLHFPNDARMWLWSIQEKVDEEGLDVDEVGELCLFAGIILHNPPTPPPPPPSPPPPSPPPLRRGGVFVA